MGAATLSGWLASQLYQHRHKSPNGAASFASTMILLTLLIAIVTQVIGDNVARAFSLVGAVSIVRFRSVVHDTKDIAFVLFAVVLGMASGAGYFQLCLLALGSGAIVSYLLLPSTKTLEEKRSADWKLTLKMSTEEHSVEKIEELIGGQVHANLLNSMTKGGGLKRENTYRIPLGTAKEASALLEKISAAPGVEQVQLTKMLGRLK